MGHSSSNDAFERISAAPTKAFFVDMITRDIPIEQAVMDLLDNSVDGAKRISAGQDSFAGCAVNLTLNGDEFRIVDSCGGFGRAEAAQYAFRFGRDSRSVPTPNSIGQFGVGMKRALFKFGRRFKVQSATERESWAVEVDVDSWENDSENWTFEWDEFASDQVSADAPGTDIQVTALRPEVSATFSSPNFENQLVSMVKSKHRQFISRGLAVTVNGRVVAASDVLLAVSDDVVPGVVTYADSGGGAPVQVKIVVGVGESSPRDAGWYVVCNGRVVLEADRRNTTGWGAVEDELGRIVIPHFHNQFSRFRGIVFFDSADSSRVPWNTTKTDIDRDSPIWRRAFEQMKVAMRPVIDFLNALDEEVDEYGQNASPMLAKIMGASKESVDVVAHPSDFRVTASPPIAPLAKTVKIQYSRLATDIEELQDALGLTSAKAVGEKTFDLILEMQR